MDLGMGTFAILGSASGGIANLAIALVAYRNREFPGAVPYGWLALAGSGWCFMTMLQMAASTPAGAETAHLLGGVISSQVVALWLVFGLVYTGRQQWVTPARLLGLFLVPNSYTILLLTAPVHGLVSITAVPVTENGATLFVIRHGSIYIVQLLVSYGLILIGWTLLLEFLFQSRNVYRKQTAAILLGTGFPLLTFTAFKLGLTPHPGVNLTPMTFALNAVFIGWALFEYESLSVTPLSGDHLVDNLPDPVFALDTENTIVDFNEAASTAFTTENPVGESIESLSPGLLDSIERGDVFAMGDSLTYYNPRLTSITDQFDNQRGRLVVLRDVTGQQRRQDRLEALQSATQQFIGAEAAETVSKLAVQYATRILDQNAAGVFLRTDDETLEPVVLSDAVEEYVDESLLHIGPDDENGNKIWDTYETGTHRVITLDRDGVGPLQTAFVLPLGDHGVLAIGSTTKSFATEDKQYAEVLAQTTQVALDQVERESELRQSRSAVKRRREQIEFFNGALRHSLHNAMVVIRGRAEYLRDDVPPAKQRHLDSITTWCGRLTEMSETIRDINNTVTASEAERLETVDLTSSIQRSIETIREEYSSAVFECSLDEDLYVQANDLLEEVLLSILRNSVDHNDSDQPRVTVTTQQASEWLQVRIADNGRGISDEMKTTVFERTLTPDESAGGFGIYFVSVMMDLYSGNIWFEDNDPSGTIAVLEFQQATAADFESEKVSIRAGPASSGFGTTGGAEIIADRTETDAHNGDEKETDGTEPGSDDTTSAQARNDTSSDSTENVDESGPTLDGTGRSDRSSEAQGKSHND